MNKHKPIGSYQILNLYKELNHWPIENIKGTDMWKPSRPIPFYCLKERIRMAWDVLTYKADALYW